MKVRISRQDAIRPAPKPKKKRRKARNRFVKPDAEFRAIIMERDKWTCQKCGKGYSPGDRGIHVSHFFPKGDYPWLRHDPDNACAKCYRCHIVWWHHNPIAADAWLVGYLGTTRYEALCEKAYTSPKVAATPKKARETRKHIAKPGTATEIRKALGITRADVAAAEAVLRETRRRA